MLRLTFLTIAFAFGVAAIGAQEPEAVSGPELIDQFKMDLQQALRKGLSEGTEEAIAACQMKAPEIVEALTHDGVRLGRTSDRLRNPSNTAPDWVLEILEDYKTNPETRSATTVSLEDQRSGYVEPIVVQPLCVKCHGSKLAPEVATRIAELYPEDRAVGYEVGDLRGVFWAEFPLSVPDEMPEAAEKPEREGQ